VFRCERAYSGDKAKHENLWVLLDWSVKLKKAVVVDGSIKWTEHTTDASYVQIVQKDFSFKNCISCLSLQKNGEGSETRTNSKFH
jgi:hypothetical protein